MFNYESGEYMIIVSCYINGEYVVIVCIIARGDHRRESPGAVKAT